MKLFITSFFRSSNISFLLRKRLKYFFLENDQINRCLSSFHNQYSFLNYDLKDVSVSTLHSQHKENTLCHQILESKQGFNVICFPNIRDGLFNVKHFDNLDKIINDPNLINLSSKDILNVFKSVSINSHSQSLKPISDPIFINLTTALIGKLQEFSDEELASALLYLSLWPMSESSKSENFCKVWKALDSACLARMKGWRLDKILYFMDLWYLLKLTRMSDFVFQSLFVLHQKKNQLTPQQLVQLLFYLNTIRTLHKNVVMYNFEYKLEEYFNELSLQEIGVGLLGFFKTRSPIRSEDFLKRLIDRTINEIETISEITLTSILKSLRFSMQIRVWKELPRLLDALVPYLNNFSLQCLAHVSLLTSTSQTFHPASLDIVSQRLIDDIKHSRLKDMEKVLFPISRLDYDPKTGVNLYSTVVKELNLPSRQKEIEMFPRCFYALLHCLALRSVFPQKLIAKALDTDFIHKTYGPNRYHFGRELTFIDTCLELECSDYNGPRLPQDTRSYLNKRYSHFAPNEYNKLSKHSSLALDILNTVQSVFGQNSAKFIYTIPSHPRPDIILRSGGLPEELLSLPDFEGPVKAPSDKCTTVLMVISKNMCCSNCEDPFHLNGESVTKIRGIKILGHSLKLVLYNQWPLTGSILEKEHVLKKILVEENQPIQNLNL